MKRSTDCEYLVVWKSEDGEVSPWNWSLVEDGASLTGSAETRDEAIFDAGEHRQMYFHGAYQV